SWFRYAASPLLNRRVRAVSRDSTGGVSQFSSLVGAFVHGVGERDERMRRLVQDAPPLLNVVAVEPHDERLVGTVPELSEGADDAVRHRVAGGDAAEDVDEHA